MCVCVICTVHVVLHANVAGRQVEVRTALVGNVIKKGGQLRTKLRGRDNECTTQKNGIAVVRMCAKVTLLFVKRALYVHI